jgi:hypothetical protein
MFAIIRQINARRSAVILGRPPREPDFQCQYRRKPARCQRTDGHSRMTEQRNRIMIFGPKSDGTYVIEFLTAAGESLAISIPRTEAAVIRHFQERMPYGLYVPDVQEPDANLVSS